MAESLISSLNVGDSVDFTTQRLGRLCNGFGDKVRECPHCKRRGMRIERLNGKVEYIHKGQLSELRLESLDACKMWPRAEFKLRYGSDSIHPKYRRPGDDDMTIEEIR